jgi:hypothetical protein
MQRLLDDLERWEREDSPWVYEKTAKELPRMPVRGAGGKPTGEYLPSGKESMQQMEMMMGRKQTPAGANPDGLRVPDRTDKNEAQRLVEQKSMDAILAPLKSVASAMERKWGVNRLQTLVDESWAMKFASAADKLNTAVASRSFNDVREKAEVMRRGWTKLDEIATAAGAQQFNGADVWELKTPKGRVIAIARTDVDQANAHAGDGVAVFTLAEVAQIIEAWDKDGSIGDMRAEFPDSRLVGIHMPGDKDFDDVPF